MPWSAESLRAVLGRELINTSLTVSQYSLMSVSMRIVPLVSRSSSYGGVVARARRDVIVTIAAKSFVVALVGARHGARHGVGLVGAYAQIPDAVGARYAGRQSHAGSRHPDKPSSRR
jgi:hypothetical protein